MAHPLRFGVEVFARDWPTLLERARYIESLGLDSLWLPDHSVNFYSPDVPWLEAWTGLAALATQTTRIRLGPLVSHFTFRNPVNLARQALMVDYISNGRLELGIGAGGVPTDYTVTGVGPWGPAERLQRFREGVAIVDALLRGEKLTFTGDYFHTKDAYLQPPAIQKPRPPLTLAALHRPALKVVAHYADAWSSFLGVTRGIVEGTGQPTSAQEAWEVTRQRKQILDEECAKIGRDPATIRSSLLAWPLYSPDAPFASVDAFQEFTGKYIEIGIDEFIFGYPVEGFHADASPAVFERVATDVMPRLRNRR